MSFPNKAFRLFALGMLLFLLAPLLSCNSLTDSGKTFIVVRNDSAWTQFDSLVISWKDSVTGEGGILFSGNPSRLKTSNPFLAEGYQGQKIVVTFLGFQQNALAYEERRTFDGAVPDKVQKEIIPIGQVTPKRPGVPKILALKFDPDSVVSIHDSIWVQADITLDSGALKQYAWSIGRVNSATDAEIYDPPQALSGLAADMERGFRFADPGIYPVALKVIARNDSAAIARFRIIVLSDPPHAFAGKDTTVFIGAKINLRGIAKDSLGKITRTEWRIGNSEFVTASADTFFQAPDSAQEIEAIFRVTDDDAQSTSDTLRVYVVSATESNLTGLQVSQGKLHPAFAPTRLIYTDTVLHQTPAITVTPEGSGAITVNGKSVTSGQATSPIDLDFGDNTLTIEVRADGKAVKTYTLTVHRPRLSQNADLSALEISAGALSPPFSPEETHYNVWVPQAITTTTVLATLADTASNLTMNGFPMKSQVPSGTLNLIPGSNLISLETVSASGSKKTYVVQVTRGGVGNLNLSELAVSAGTLEPSFSPDSLVYSLSLPYSVDTLSVTATLAQESASLSIHRRAAVSGRAVPIAIPTGMTAITVLVKTPSDEAKSYTLIVTRDKNGDASLKSISVAPRVLDSIVKEGDTTYSAHVSHATDSVTITAEATVSSSQITLRGETLASGQASRRIALAIGANAIPITVTAENLATKRYVLKLIRAKNGNVELSQLVASVGTLIPPFASDRLDYSLQAGFADSVISITPTLADSRSTLQVNGRTLTSGTASTTVKVPVNSKDNAFIIVVTAENLSQRVYNIVVDRMPNTLSTLKSISASAGKVVQVNAIEYVDTVGHGVTQVTLLPLASDMNATVSILGKTIPYGSSSDSLALVVGDNSIPCLVTAQDGKSQTLHTVRITRLAKLVRIRKTGATQTPLDSVEIPLGRAHTISAPIVTGYHFVKWSVVAGEASLADSMAAATTVTLSQGNASIRAEYELNTYALTVNTVNCSLTRSPDKPAYAHGENVTLTVKPYNTYRFATWADGSAENPRTLSMTAPTTLSVSCPAIPTYAITLLANPTGAGTITTVPSGTSFIEGTRVRLTPAPAPGYHFIGWSGDLTGSAIPDSVTMTQNRSVTAQFELDRFSLKVSRHPGLPSGCLVTPSAAQTVNYGAPTPITASAGCQISVASCAPIGTVYSYYTFSHWAAVTGSATIADSTRLSTTVTLTQGNAEIIANYSVETECVDLR